MFCLLVFAVFVRPSSLTSDAKPVRPAPSCAAAYMWIGCIPAHIAQVPNPCHFPPRGTA